MSVAAIAAAIASIAGGSSNSSSTSAANRICSGRRRHIIRRRSRVHRVDIKVIKCYTYIITKYTTIQIEKEISSNFFKIKIEILSVSLRL